MSKIEKMNREAANLISEEVRKALAPVLENLGISISKQSGTYDPDANTFGLRLTFAAPLAEGVIPPEWSRNAWRFDLKGDDFGRQFDFRGSRFEIVGLRPRARKAPIVVRDIGKDQLYHMSAGAVASGLGREDAKEKAEEAFPGLGGESASA